MSSQFTLLRYSSALLSAIALCAICFTSANAAHIEYGDFSGTSVMYLDVEEVANTPGDEAPLYGAPSIIGDHLDFDPSGLSAASTNAVSDITDGQLNFTLMSLPGGALSSMTIAESGDYTLTGTGTAATQVSYGLSLASVTVLEVDGVALASPVVLDSAAVFGTANLSAGQVSGAPWGLSLDYDFNAALASAGVSYTSGATKVEIAINNTLTAISEASTAAFIAKKDFNITVNQIPEPASLTLLGLVTLGAGLMYKRQTV